MEHYCNDCAESVVTDICHTRPCQGKTEQAQVTYLKEWRSFAESAILFSREKSG